MKKGLIPGIALMLALLWACKKDLDWAGQLEGRWEAAYLIDQNQDTLFYEAGSVFPCAYAVLPFEYNSGFELSSDQSGDLIWCGALKKQFITWSYQDQTVEVNFLDKRSSFSIEKIEEDGMLIRVGTNRYFMEREE